MKAKFIIFTLLVCANLICFAQGGFSKNYFLNNVNTAQCIDAFEAPNGNIISIGVASNGWYNTLKIMGADQQGNKLWEKSYGSEKFEYLLGILENRTVIYDNNAFFIYRAVRDSNYKYLSTLIKFNYNGDTIWQKKYYQNKNKYFESDKDLLLQAASKSVDGGFLLCGVAYDNVNFYAIIIIKTDANGNELWRKFYSKPNAPYFIEPVKAIQDSASKRIFLIGNQFRYDGHPEQGYSNYGTVFLFDSLGNFINSKWFNGLCGGGFLDGLQTKDKNFVAIGLNDQCNNLGSRRNKSYLVKFNHSLQTIFTKEYDTLSIYNQFTSMQEYANGDLLIAGSYDTLHNYNVNIKYGLRIIKTDKNGLIKKRRWYNYDTNPVNAKLSKSLNLLSNNGAIATYWLAQKPGGMPFSFTVVDSTLCDSTLAFCGTVGLNDLSYNSGDVSIYPQPAKEQLSISSNLFDNKKATTQITNNLGQLFLNTTVQFNNGTLKLPLGNLPKGIYILKLTDENLKNYSQKIIVE